MEGVSCFSPLLDFPLGFLCRPDDWDTATSREFVTWNLSLQAGLVRMDKDLQVRWAKHTLMYESEVDVLMSEPLRARRIYQALGEPPMRTDGQ